MRGQRLRRRALTACAAFALALGLFGAYPAPAAASILTTSACSTYDQSWAGIDTYPTYGADGAEAHIDTGSGDSFSPCSGTGDGNEKGATGWVAVESGVTFNGFTQILQAGIIVCKPTSITICWGEGSPRYFYAVGGCTADPFPRDLGAATSGTHFFQLRLISGGASYHIWIDGVDRVTVSTTDPQMTCWRGVRKLSSWYCERFDHGDSCGSSAYQMTFTTMQTFNYDTFTWVNPGFHTNDPCTISSPGSSPEQRCHISSTSSMQVWQTP